MERRYINVPLYLFFSNTMTGNNMGGLMIRYFKETLYTTLNTCVDRHSMRYNLSF